MSGDIPSPALRSDRLSLLVLAAGMGSRYGGLKQMDAMGPHGESILDYSVYDALRAGFDRIVFVIRRDFSALFERQVLARYVRDVDVSCVFQDPRDLPAGFVWPVGRTKPWGTLHAVLAARQHLDGYFAVVNADDFYGQAAYQAMARHHRQWLAAARPARSCSMVAYELSHTLSDHGGVNRGICTVNNGLLEAVEEVVDIQLGANDTCTGRTLTGQAVSIAPQVPASMNFWGFAPQLIPDLQQEFVEFLRANVDDLRAECYIPTVLSKLITSGRAECHVLSAKSHWFGVTYAQDQQICRRNIEQLIREGAYPAHLWR